MYNTRLLFLSFCCLLPNFIMGQNITLRTQAEVNAFNPSTTSITGNLIINGSGIAAPDAIQSLQPLTALTYVNGNLEIINTSSLPNLGGLSQITATGGRLYIENNGALVNIDSLRSLQIVGTDFRISSNYELRRFELVSLDSIGRSLEIISNGVLEIDGFPNLRHIRRNLTIENNYSLSHISGFPELRTIGLKVYVKDNGKLESIEGMARLETIGGALDIKSNDLLTSLNGFTSLRVIGDVLSIQENDMLLTLNNFPALDTIESNLDVFHNTELQAMDGLSNLKMVGGNIWIEQNPKLSNLDGLSGLTNVGGSLTIRSHPILPDIDGLINVKNVGQITIQDNPILTNINGLSGLTSLTQGITIQDNDDLLDLNGLANIETVAGNFQIYRNGITTLDGLENLKTIGGITLISNNYDLVSIEGLSNLVFVGSDFYLEGGKSPNFNGLSNLDSVGGNFGLCSDSIKNYTGLSDLTYIGGDFNGRCTAFTSMDGLPSLSFIGGALHLEWSDLVTLGSLPSLDTIAGGIVLENNWYLLEIDALSNITSVPSIAIIDNHQLLSIHGLSNLHTVTGDFEITSNYDLLNMDGLQNLSHIGGSFKILNNDRLKNLGGLNNLGHIGNLELKFNDSLQQVTGLDQLATTTGNILIESNLHLSHIGSLQNLTRVGGSLSILSNPMLTTIEGLSKLSYIGGSLVVKSNSKLTRIGKFAHQFKIRYDLECKSNYSLTDCCGLQELITTYAIGRNIIIQNNDPGCNSQEEVIREQCDELQIYNDLNINCTWDNDENWLVGRLVTVEPGNYVFEFGGSQSLELLPAGAYTMTLDTTGPWTTDCPISREFDVLGPSNITDIAPFALTTTQPCNVPEISIVMSRARPCFENTIAVQACNALIATGALENAKVLITLDDHLSFLSSSIPAQPSGPSTYLFELGTINPGICVNFSIDVQVDCETVLGQTLCMKAELFPIDTCVFEEDPETLLGPDDCQLPYDGSNIVVSTRCEGDSIFFEVLNESDGDMVCATPVRFYTDGEIAEDAEVLLLANENRSYSFPADGRTWRIEVDQHPLRPGQSNPTATIERCGDTQYWTPGHVNERYLDDEDTFVDEFCITATGSFDPNDKTGFPTGVGDAHRILPGQSMEYMIRFQNTGTDTAFTVVIRDTLDAKFEILSVRNGATSHPYTFEMFGPGVLQWTMNNILLPDSNTNEPASHGFVTFRVQQKPNLAHGIPLKNSASIYFDFNDPIITNTTTHLVDHWIKNFTTAIPDHPEINKSAIRIYPNPVRDYMTIELDKTYDKIEIEVFSLIGTKLISETYYIKNSIALPALRTQGLCMLVIRLNDGPRRTLKFMVH